MYVKSCLEVEVLTSLPDLGAGVDAVWLLVNTGHGHKLIFGSIYVPPDVGKPAFIDNLSTLLDSSAFNGREVALVGDFNINWNRASNIVERFRNLAYDHNLVQMMSGLSHVSATSGNETLLDLAFVSRTVVTKQACILTTDISDHYALSLTLGTRRERPPRRLIKTRCIRKALPIIFSEGREPNRDLISQIEQQTSSSVQASLLENWILQVVDRHAPLKTVRLRHEAPRWLTPELKRLVSCKNRYYRQVTDTKTLTEKNWNQYKKFRNYVQSQLNKSKREYYSSELSADSSSFFRHVNILLGRKPKSNSAISRLKTPNGGEVNDPAAIANHLNEFFTTINAPTPTAQPVRQNNTPAEKFSFEPITEREVRTALLKLDPKKCGGAKRIPASVYRCLEPTVVPALTVILNTTFTSQEFPQIYKHALVSPIYKKGVKTDPSNYRPISSLPILSKIVETIMNNQIVIYLNANTLLSSKQFGFRQGLSTEHMLLTLCDTYLKQLDSKTPKFIAQLGLDIKKAFDTVHHDLLLAKLSSQYGFSSEATAMIRSYLSNRSQSMRVANHVSPPLPITKGVPQGSILGPLLFNIMVNDMLTSHNNTLSYADDTILFAIGDTQVSAVDKVLSSFMDIQSWYTSNGLALSAPKTKCIIFSNRSTLSFTSVAVDGHNIPVQPHVKLLGVWLDSKLNFSHHIDCCTSAANSSIYVLRKIRPYLDSEQCKLIYTSIIRPKLEYCSSLLLSITKSLATKLERSQNKAIRAICLAPSIFSVNDARSLVGIHTLASRREYYFSQRIRTLYASEPHNHPLYNLLTSNVSAHNRYLRSCCTLAIPSVNSHFGHQSFSYQATRALHRGPPMLAFRTDG